MKVLGVFALAFACVAARGSGPYLPSGWRPDGPAFYLPSDIPKPAKEPVKEVIFSESEASGSDFLREYGPPKVQEVSQDISQQALPDVINEQLFKASVVELHEVKEKSNVAEVTEEKVEVTAEGKAADEPLAVTEPQVVTATESAINIQEDLQSKDETTTLANVVESVDAVNIFGYLEESTEAIIAPTEKLNTEVSEQPQNQITEDTVGETQEVTSEQQEIIQSVRQEEKTGNSDTLIVTSEAEQRSTVTNIEAESSNIDSSDISETQKADFDIISTVEEKIETVENEVKKIEEVVQNIPEIIVSLEKEVQSQQAETIQVTPAIVQEVFGSLDQAPEGFLEYGPPGFSEYGPPKEDLRDNTNEEKISEAQVSDNFVRRRRFSPKVRFYRKSL